MIVSQIIGGLGNQMFQYAAGRALALTRGQALRLDVSGFANYGLHQGFELRRVFNVPVENVAKGEVCRLLGWQYGVLPRRILSRPGMALFRRREFVVEPHFHYWPGISEVPSDCYLVGYWQSEKYFQIRSAAIRTDFTFMSPLVDENARLAEEIGRVNSISLHVRRGDYVSNPKNRKVLDVCPLEYYRQAVGYIAERVENPVFYLFSDDMEWVKAALVVTFPCIYVEHNIGAESYRDMQLMSLCRHHIIANSSFSWWGAWLDANPEKMVVAPRGWFQNANDDRDLIPETWVRL